MTIQTNKQHPFKPRQLVSPSFFHRMFGKLPRKNAIIDLKNALAATTRVSELSNLTIVELSNKYKVDMFKAFSKDLQRIYTDYIKYCLRDHKFSQDEAQDLSHLQQIFAIPDRQHNQIYQQAAEEIFRKALNDILADSQVTADKKNMIESLKKDLDLPESVSKKIFATETLSFLQNKLDVALEDKMLSPEEDEEIQLLMKQLDVTVSMDNATTETLERCRLMWRIVHGNPPTIDVPIKLPKKEVCYFFTDAEWHEMRKQRQRIQYAGPTMRLKICKGVYWRMGDIAVRPVTQDVLTLIDEGTVYVTNKRLIFTGKMKNMNISLNKILDVTPYKDGVDIDKDSGHSPFLKFTKNIDIFCACLARAIQDAP